jgi:hypothetical protein
VVVFSLGFKKQNPTKLDQVKRGYFKDKEEAKKRIRSIGHEAHLN